MNTIFRTTYILTAFAFLLASCRQEDLPVSPQEIGDRIVVFNTSIPGMTTKAESISKDLDKFFVTVFDESDGNYIDHTEGKLQEYVDSVLIEESLDSRRLYSLKCLWPGLKQEKDILHFLSYYPQLPDGASLLNNTSVNGDEVSIGYGIKAYSIATDIAKQADFVTAYAKGSMINDYQTGVELNFKHQLSRIEVKAKGAHKSCDIEIAGVGFGSTVMQGTFKFQTSDAFGEWAENAKGNCEYIFKPDDEIVKVGADPVSIMGSKLGEEENCAMLIPSTSSAWAYATDAKNVGKGLYLNVLLRVIDATNTTGKGQQRYPYNDNNQGLNSPNIPRVYLAVNNSGVVTANPGRLYKDDNGIYYTNEAKTRRYIAPPGSSVKEFGWAAIPISGTWEPGMIYTYTLDYTYGVGVHGPETPGEVAPMSGDPIIGDMVGVALGFKDWVKNSKNGTGIDVPDK